MDTNDRKVDEINTTRNKSTDRPNTITLDDFNTPLSPINRSSRQRINKGTSELSDTTD
jgi:hypothetical protein